MNEMNLGGTLRELRRKKGVTQETLAQALCVTPQAVSKWESGVSYPEMTMIPLIAGYFEVSLDTLFDYDIRRVKTHIRQLLDEARAYFYDDPARYADTVRGALAENPGNEDLLCALMDSYEHSMRNFGETEHLDEMIDIGHQIISSSRDFTKVCAVKDLLASAYLKKGMYGKAREILDTLPAEVTLKHDAMAYRLSGEDKLTAAREAQKLHLQDLYLACWEEGNGLYHAGDYAKALDAYTRGLTVLTAFLIPGTEGEGAYLWPGMQTFHYGFHLWRAGCLKKLGRAGEAGSEVEKAYRIIRGAWSDFQERPDHYMENFYDCLKEFGLEEYKE